MVSGFSRRRSASSQGTGRADVSALQVTKLDRAIRGRKCFMTPTWGSTPTVARNAAWSCQAERVQNVRRSGFATSDTPMAPGDASIWCLTRMAATRNEGTSRSRRSSKRDAMMVTGPSTVGGDFGEVQGIVGMLSGLSTSGRVLSSSRTGLDSGDSLGVMI